MPFKRLLFTLIGIAVLVALFSLFNLNRDLLLSPFFYTSQKSVPTWAVFLVVGVSLLLLPFLLNLIQDVRNLPTVWSSWRKEKSHRETEQRYARAAEEVRSGNDPEALELFRAILNRDPEHVESLLAAGNLHRRRGEYSDAIELHKRANRLRETDPRTLSELAADYEASGDPGRAMAVLAEMVSRHPRHALEPYRRMRALCVLDGNWEKAWEVQQRIQDLEKKSGAGADSAGFSIGIRYELALARKRDGQARDAETLLRRLLKEAPDFAPASLELGRLLAAAGKGSEALKVWKSGFARTGSPVFLQMVEGHHLEADEPDQAIDAIREMGREPEHALICRLTLGRLFERLEMVDQALEEFLALEGELPAAPVVVRHIARLMERRGRHQEASSRYAQLIESWKPISAEYRCRRCQAPATEWRDRCESCGAWGSFAFPIQESLGSVDPGISHAPVYSTG